VIITYWNRTVCNKNQKGETFRRFTDDIVWLCFGSQIGQGIKNILEIGCKLLRQAIKFRQTNIIETDGLLASLDMHHYVMPNENHGFIKKGSSQRQLNKRHSINEQSHQPCPTFKSFGEAIRKRRMNECEEGKVIISHLSYDCEKGLYSPVFSTTWSKA